MVVVLIGMKSAIVRRGMTDARASWVLTGVFVGMCLAAATIRVATLGYGQVGSLMDVLALILAMWTVGWMLGPLWSGEPALSPEHFALEPIPRRTLALGLLCAALVGVTTGVTVVAFASVVVFAARLGVVAALLAVPVVVLQVLLVVLLSRLTGRGLRTMSGSRVGAAATGLCTAAMMVASQSGWMAFIALDEVLAHGFPRGFSLALRTLPSSWGLLAVEAAGRSDWLSAAAVTIGLGLLIGVLFGLWARSLGPRRADRSVVRGSRRRVGGPRATHATTAVCLKEWRTWGRDAQRVQALVAAPAFALMFCALPLVFDSTSFLPFAGALTATMAAVTSANLYGQDGTALWLTLLVPGSERADVRGRQLAWLVLFGPLSIALTVGGVLWDGKPQLWPWALAATIGALGHGSGVMLVVAVDRLVPGPDPQRRKGSPLDHGDVTGQAFLALIAVLIASAPALGVVFLGERLGNASIVWAGVALSVLLAGSSVGFLGRRAHRVIASRGPELLSLMRAGKPSKPACGHGGDPSARELPKRRGAVIWGCVVAGLIACVPQALVPTIMKTNGTIAPVWFLALHLPSRWQWPVIGLMCGLGLLLLGISGVLYRGHVRTLPAGHTVIEDRNNI